MSYVFVFESYSTNLWVFSSRAALEDRTEETRVRARQAAEYLRTFNAGEGDKAEVPALLGVYASVAHYEMRLMELDQARYLCTRGIELAEAFGRQTDRGLLLTYWAMVMLFQGDLDEALQTSEEALRLLDPGSADASYVQIMNFAWALINRGDILGADYTLSLERPKEAVVALDRAFRMVDELVYKDPSDQTARGRLARAGQDMADILRHWDAAAALSIYDHALRHIAEVGGKRLQLQAVNLLVGSSYALRRLGRPAEARQRIDAAFDRLRELKLYPSERIDTRILYDAHRALADYEAEARNLPRAIEIYQSVLKGLQAGGDQPETRLVDAYDASTVYQAMVALYRRSGRTDLASAFEKRRVELWRHWARKLPYNPFVLRQISAAARP